LIRGAGLASKIYKTPMQNNNNSLISPLSKGPKYFKVFLLSLQIVIILSAFAYGQTGRAVLRGLVTDEAGAIIPGARLVLRDEAGFSRDAVSDDTGAFSFGELPHGRYELTVSKESFALVTKSIELNAGTSDSNLTMAAGEVDAVVTVVMDSSDAAVDSTLKSGLSAHETPRSISTIGSERMRDQNFRQVSDVINYVPGTTQNSYRNGSYHFYSRGFRMGPEDTRLDGFAGATIGGGGFGVSMFGIEEAVVLRGPASLLYGQTGSPGGLINLVSKRPQEQYFTRVDLRGGGYSGNGVSLTERPMYGIDIDSTGPLTGGGRIMYRGLVAVENMNYFTANTLDRNRYLHGSVSIKLDEEGRYVLTPGVQYTRYRRPFGGGIVISPSSSLSASQLPPEDPDGSSINENDLSPLDVNLFGGRRQETIGWAGIELRAVPSEKMRFNAAYRQVSLNTDINSFSPQVNSASQIAALRNDDLVFRIQSKSLTERTYHNLNSDFSYEWLALPQIRNTTQVGFYSRNLISRTTSPLGPLPVARSPINIYTGVTTVPLEDTYPELAFRDWAGDLLWNGFVQNRTSLGGGRVHVGLGFNYGQQHPEGRRTRKSGIMPNASLLFNVTPELAVYGSYSTSFNPVDPDLEDVNGQRGTFGATTGRNYEVGAKYDLLNRRLGLAFSLYQVQLDNALVISDIGVLNPNNNRFYIPAGTRRARGMEFSGNFQVRHDLSVRTGIAYTAAIYRGFPDGAATASAPIPNSWAEKTPRWAYSVYTRYDKREGTLRGFGAGLGVIWQGKRLGSNGARTFSAPDPLVLPAFTRVDTGLFYRAGRHVEFALNVENLFDQRILVNAAVASAIEIAAPRTATFRTTFNF
jgi:iron complex outermembrane receptor protein